MGLIATFYHQKKVINLINKNNKFKVIIMEIKEFIEKFAEAIEIENVDALTADTKFHDLEEWSSLAVMLLIAFFDDEFNKELTPVSIKEADTIQDLFNIAIA